jgi:hypothetical protein
MALTKVDPSVVDDQVFGRRNIIINGNFNIYQRSQQESGLGASSGYFTADRWRTNFTTSGRLTMTAGTADAPTESNSSTSLKLDCTTADTSIASSENLILQHLIEGFNLQHLKKGTSGAKQLTVSFWVKGNGNATYVVELYDNDNARQISKSFSVTSSWSKVELTFPADTTGAFGNDANVSLYLSIWLHAGSNFTSGTLNSSSWASNTNANRAVGISSFFSSTDNLFYITDVQLEVGDTATPFEHRSYGEELTLCQRYYEKFFYGGSAVKIGNHSYGNWNTIQPKRAQPTMSISGNMTYWQTDGSSATGGTAQTVSFRQGSCAARTYLFNTTLVLFEGDMIADAEL